MDFRFPLLLWDPKNLKKTETCFGCDLADCGRASMDFEGEMNPTNCKFQPQTGAFLVLFWGSNFRDTWRIQVSLKNSVGQ